MNFFIPQPSLNKKVFPGNCIKKLFFLALLFSATLLHGQTSNSFLLIKTSFVSQNAGAGNFSFQWVAANNTAKAGNFFILENLPAGYEIQSIAMQASTTTTPSLSPALPMAGPASLAIGPFPIAANSSVTFLVAGSSTNPSAVGESFYLLSDSQMSAKNGKSVTGRTDLENSSPGGLIQSLVAAPNISNSFEPINFLLNLNSPAQVSLTLYNIAGEKVFSAQAQEAQGKSTIEWTTQNNNGRQVASGLYIYVLKAAGTGYVETRTGKVLIIH